MTLLQRLLLLPLLSPLLAVLLLGAVNPRPFVALRLLTWTSPALPLGAWISAAAAAGAGLSALGSALALQGGLQGSAEPEAPRRQVRRQPRHADDDAAPAASGRGRREAPEPDLANAWAGPPRAAGEPAPTVSVPFRVIRRAQATPGGGNRAPAATAAGADNGDDWDAPVHDDW
mgnify:CR=1 FL=1